MTDLKKSFPDNILERLGIEKRDIPEDFIATLYYLVYTSYKFLPPEEHDTTTYNNVSAEIEIRNANIFMMYFKDNMTYGEIAATYGITTERVRQLLDKQIKKLSLSTRRNVLQLGLNKYLYLQKINKEKEWEQRGYNKAYRTFQEAIQSIGVNVENVAEIDLTSIDIEEMNLSVRAYNCLKRAGVMTVSDIIQMGNANLRCVRNLGKRCYAEIVEQLVKRYGESPMNWRDIL